MRVDITVLEIRDNRDNRLIDVIPLRDAYTSVQVEYDSDYVTPAEIRAYVESWMGKDHQMAIKAERDLAASGIWVDEQEAKDFNDVGFMTFRVVEKEVDWK